MEYAYLTSQPGHLVTPSGGEIHVNAHENVRYTEAVMLTKRRYDNMRNQTKSRKHYS